jgi:multicomponent Na+:H+ antiporter subunit D
MHALVPLTVAVPAIGGAFLVAFGGLGPSWIAKLLAISAAGAVATLSTILLVATDDRPIEYSFGGWQPRHGVVIAIVFSVEPIAAATVALAAALMTCSLVYAWRYFEETSQHYHALMLVFLTGMVGFAFSADLFDLFVFFELMGVCAFALTGYDVARPGPIQGAINFAVTNSIGGFLIVIGIALLYGRTGGLNLAQIGETVAGTPPNGLAVAAFAVLISGFLVKAGAVPFHFWLPDAYAVAPATVGVLLSGVMSDLGLHGIERVYWLVFSDGLGSGAGSVRAVLVGVASVTSLIGAVMAFLQSNLKRMLAFVTVSQVGVALAGIALLTAPALAGASVAVVAQGLTRGGLFLAVGLVLHELGHDDELLLRGRGRGMMPAAVLFTAAALALAGLPPFGPFLGTALIEQAAADAGYGWLPAALTAATLVAGGALVRAALRIFVGVGRSSDTLLIREPEDQEAEEAAAEPAPHRSPLLLVPTLALLVAGLGLSFAPRLAGQAEAAAARAVDRKAEAAYVLRHEAPPPPPRAVTGWPQGWTWALGGVSAAGAIALAGLSLLPVGRPLPLRRLCRALHAAHTGVIGDYVAWLLFGTGLLGGIFALLLV